MPLCFRVILQSFGGPTDAHVQLQEGHQLRAQHRVQQPLLSKEPSDSALPDQKETISDFQKDPLKARREGSVRPEVHRLQKQQHPFEFHQHIQRGDQKRLWILFFPNQGRSPLRRQQWTLRNSLEPLRPPSRFSDYGQSPHERSKDLFETSENLNEHFKSFWKSSSTISTSKWSSSKLSFSACRTVLNLSRASTERCWITTRRA